VDEQDYLGRTPLHIACMKNYLECAKILLYELADPFKKTNEGKAPADLTENNMIHYFLARSRCVRSYIYI
jgi:ankyrin repeat protein